MQRFADGFSILRRSPVLHSLSEHGLDYEDVSFPRAARGAGSSLAPGSGKLIIANHPMGFSWSGMPAGLYEIDVQMGAAMSGKEFTQLVQGTVTETGS